jgi:hypothetical protein
MRTCSGAKVDCGGDRNEDISRFDRACESYK